MSLRTLNMYLIGALKHVNGINGATPKLLIISSIVESDYTRGIMYLAMISIMKPSQFNKYFAT